MFIMSFFPSLEIGSGAFSLIFVGPSFVRDFCSEEFRVGRDCGARDSRLPLLFGSSPVGRSGRISKFFPVREAEEDMGSGL